MKAALALVFTLAAGGALAAPACNLPTQVSPAPELPAPRNEIVRGVPTAYYVLALTWSPEWCRTRADNPADRLQCRQNNFGFILHGLWSNAAKGRDPRYCGPAPRLSRQTVQKHICMTPSATLMQHEWAAHGTCGWTDSEAYFDQAAALWTALRPPPLSGAATAGDVRTAFVRMNPGLPRSAVIVRVDNRQRLTEVRICHDRRFRPFPCPGGGGAPDRLRLRITPRR